MIRSYEMYKNSAGEKIRALRERPGENPQDTCVVLFHGRSVDKDEWGAFVALSDFLIDAGYDVFRFDFRGQGQSDGEFTSIESNKEDIRTTLQYLEEEKGYSSYIFVAASFAGAAVLGILEEVKSKVKGLVLRNAVVDFDYVRNPQSPKGKKKWEKRKQEMETRGYFAINGRGKVNKEGYEQMMTEEPFRVFEHINMSITMIHSVEDEYVPYELSRKYADKYENITLHTLSGGRHGFPKGYGLDKAVQICVESVKNIG